VLAVSFMLVSSKCQAINIDETGHMTIIIILFYFFIILSGVRLSPLGSAATTGLLYQPQMMMVIVEQLVE
jgi:hypothetical protein